MTFSLGEGLEALKGRKHVSLGDLGLLWRKSQFTWGGGSVHEELSQQRLRAILLPLLPCVLGSHDYSRIRSHCTAASLPTGPWLMRPHSPTACLSFGAGFRVLSPIRARG